MKIRVLGIAASPRHGNTEVFLKEALKGSEELKEVTTEFITMAGMKIKGGCRSSYACFKKPNKDHPCIEYKDDLNDVFQKMLTADAMIVACPVYFGGVTVELKCLIDRSMALESIGMALRNKVGGAMAVAFNRNGGLEQTIFQIKHWMEMHDMITIGIGPERPSSGIGNYWGAAGLQGYPDPVSLRIDPVGVYEAVKQDYIGMRAANFLGKRVAELTKIVKSGIAASKGELCWPSGPLNH